MSRSESAQSHVPALHQRQFLKGQQTFSFFGDDALLVRVKNFQRTEEFTIPLRNLHPTAMRFRNTAVGFAVAAAVCLIAFAVICAAIFIGLKSDSIGSRFSICILPAIFLLLPGITFLVRFVQRRCDLLLVRNRLDGSVALALWRDNPSPSEFQAFTTALLQRIEACPAPENMADQTLAGEISQLEILQRKGILTPEEFAAAKRRILGVSDGRKLGF